MSILQDFEAIKASNAEACVWDCELLFNVAEANEEPEYENLCDYLKMPANLKDRKMPKGEEKNEVDWGPNGILWCWPPNTCFMFPRKRFQGMGDKLKLVTELKLAALKAGFKLVVKSSNEKQTKFRCCTVTFACHKHILSKASVDEDTLKHEHGSHSLPREKEKRCPFTFSVFLTPPKECWITNSWFLSVIDDKFVHLGRSTHCHHHQFPAKDLHASIKLLNNDEKTLALDCAQLHMTNTAQAALLTLRNKEGISWHDHQMRYIKKRNQKMLEEEAGLITVNASSAEKLLSKLETR